LTAAAYAATLAVLYGLRILEAYLMALVGQRVTHDLRNAVFGHLLRLEAGFYDRNPVGRLMTRVLNDVEAVSDAFTSGLLAIAADVITLAGVVAVMLWMDWRLALVTFAIVPALGAVALALLIWYGGGQIGAGALSFGALVAFIQYTNRFFLPIRDLGAKYTVMQSAMASAERIFGLLERPPAIVSPADSAMVDRASGIARADSMTVDPETADQAYGATTFSLRPPTSLPDHTVPATINS